jgi:hypothetical protein
MDTSHIPDPTIKVKAPDSVLNKIGNLYVNLSITEARLFDVYKRIVGEESSKGFRIERMKSQPKSVIDYLTACQNMAYNIDNFSERITKLIGDFEWDEQGALIRLT